LVAMAEDRLPNIDKLCDANCPVWKLQIKAYLEARDCGLYVQVMKLNPLQRLPVQTRLLPLLMYNVWIDIR